MSVIESPVREKPYRAPVLPEPAPPESVPPESVPPESVPPESVPPAPRVREAPAGQAPGRHRDRPDPRTVLHGPADGLRTFRPDVEGMRAVAVALVVLYHAELTGLTGGYVGVDVFFVISGYLITTHLLGELRKNGRVSLTAFYARRAKRLLPLSFVVVVAVVLMSWVLASGLQARVAARDAFWSALFAMNIHLAQSGVDYQAGTDPSPLQHFWSLAIEEQFYLVWPVLLVVFSFAWLPGRRRRAAPTGSKKGRRRHVVGQPGSGMIGNWREIIAADIERERHGIKVSTGVLTLVVGGAAVASFLYGVHQTEVARSLAYFTTPARGWELAVGGLVALNARRIARLGWTQHWPLAVLGLAAIVGSALVLTDETAFPGYWAAIPVLGSAAVIVAGLTRANAAERIVLARPVFQGVGKISYGLYLWHWPLLLLALDWFGTDRLSPFETLLVLVLAVWISIVSFVLLEDPLRILPAFSRRPWTAVLTGVVLTVVLAGGATAAARWIPKDAADGAAALQVGAGTDVSQAISRAAQLDQAPRNLTPAPDGAVNDEPGHTIAGAADCHANILVRRLSTDRRVDCVFGDRTAPRTLVLTGDSHAFQWLPTLDAIGRAKGWRVVSLTKAACPVYDVKLVNQSVNRDYTECYAWRDAVMQRIRQERPDLVLTSGAIFNPKDDTFTPRWAAGVTTAVQELRGTGARVVLLDDTPYPRSDVPNCVSRHLSELRECASTRKDAMSDPVRRTATSRAAAAAGAVVVDPTPWFCTDRTCPPVIGNTLVYRDNSHMTATWSLLLASRLSDVIAREVLRQ